MTNLVENVRVVAESVSSAKDNGVDTNTLSTEDLALHLWGSVSEFSGEYIENVVLAVLVYRNAPFTTPQ